VTGKKGEKIMFENFDFTKIAAEMAERQSAEMAELISGWTPEQISRAKETAREWDARERQTRAWSAPVAARYGQDWEFFVQADLVEYDEEPDEVRYLRPLLNT
jgi:DNA primase large subunit